MICPGAKCNYGELSIWDEVFCNELSQISDDYLYLSGLNLYQVYAYYLFIKLLIIYTIEDNLIHSLIKCSQYLFNFDFKLTAIFDIQRADAYKKF